MVKLRRTHISAARDIQSQQLILMGLSFQLDSEAVCPVSPLAQRRKWNLTLFKNAVASCVCRDILPTAAQCSEQRLALWLRSY